MTFKNTLKAATISLASILAASGAATAQDACNINEPTLNTVKNEHRIQPLTVHVHNDEQNLHEHYFLRTPQRGDELSSGFNGNYFGRWHMLRGEIGEGELGAIIADENTKITVTSNQPGVVLSAPKNYGAKNVMHDSQPGLEINALKAYNETPSKQFDGRRVAPLNVDARLYCTHKDHETHNQQLESGKATMLAINPSLYQGTVLERPDVEKTPQTQQATDVHVAGTPHTPRQAPETNQDTTEVVRQDTVQQAYQAPADSAQAITSQSDSTQTNTQAAIQESGAQNNQEQSAPQDTTAQHPRNNSFIVAADGGYSLMKGNTQNQFDQRMVDIPINQQAYIANALVALETPRVGARIEGLYQTGERVDKFEEIDHPTIASQNIKTDVQALQGDAHLAVNVLNQFALGAQGHYLSTSHNDQANTLIRTSQETYSATPSIGFRNENGTFLIGPSWGESTRTHNRVNGKEETRSASKGMNAYWQSTHDLSDRFFIDTQAQFSNMNYDLVNSDDDLDRRSLQGKVSLGYRLGDNVSLTGTVEGFFEQDVRDAYTQTEKEVRGSLGLKVDL